MAEQLNTAQIEKIAQHLAETTVTVREKRGNGVLDYLRDNVLNPVSSGIQNTFNTSADTGRHLGAGLLGAGVGGALGLGADMLGPKSKRKPLSAMLSGGLLGAGVGGLGSAAYGLLDGPTNNTGGTGGTGGTGDGTGSSTAAPRSLYSDINTAITSPQHTHGLHLNDAVIGGGIFTGGALSADVAGSAWSRLRNRPWTTGAEVQQLLPHMPQNSAAASIANSIIGTSHNNQVMANAVLSNPQATPAALANARRILNAPAIPNQAVTSALRSAVGTAAHTAGPWYTRAFGSGGIPRIGPRNLVYPAAALLGAGAGSQLWRLGIGTPPAE